MKLILAVIRIAKMSETKKALADLGLPSFTAMPVLGRGNGHGDLEKLQAYESGVQNKDDVKDALSFVPEVPRLKSKRLITLVVTDDKKGIAVDAIVKANQSGKSGDGKIFVVNALESYAVHTGASGDETLD